MKKSNKKPELRFGGNTDEWEQREFKVVFDFLQNNALSRAELGNEGEVMNVHYGDILVKYGAVLDVSRNELTYLIDNSIVKKYQTSLLKNGDVIIADAAEDETVGKCTEISGLSDETVLSGLHTIPCRPTMKFAEGYLGYHMNSGAYHDQLLPLIQGTKVSSISKSALQDTEIVYPKSEEEQERIGAYFKNLDNLITLYQSKYEKLINFKKSILKKMFPRKGCNVPEVRFLGFTAPWEQRKLRELLESSNDRNNEGKYTQDNVLAASLGTELEEKHIFFGLRSTEESVKNYRIVKSGDVIYTKSPIKGYPNGIVRTSKGKEGIVPSLYCVYHSVNSINPSFIQSYLEDKGRLDDYLYPLVNIGARNNVNITDAGFLEGSIMIPQDIEEQTKIVNLLDKVTELITLHQRKMEKLINIKKACMDKMFV